MATCLFINSVCLFVFDYLHIEFQFIKLYYIAMSVRQEEICIVKSGINNLTYHENW